MWTVADGTISTRQECALHPPSDSLKSEGGLPSLRRHLAGRLPCPDCHHTPRADDRAIAWLFSNAHLSQEELAEAAKRIQAGEQPHTPGD